MDDEWKQVWDWARGVWGTIEGEPRYTMNRFFRRIAVEVAERHQLEEVGSSDVWCLTYGTVRLAMRAGVATREALIRFVEDNIHC